MNKVNAYSLIMYRDKAVKISLDLRAYSEPPQGVLRSRQVVAVRFASIMSPPTWTDSSSVFQAPVRKKRESTFSSHLAHHLMFQSSLLK